MLFIPHFMSKLEAIQLSRHGGLSRQAVNKITHGCKFHSLYQKRILMRICYIILCSQS